MAKHCEVKTCKRTANGRFCDTHRKRDYRARLKGLSGDAYQRHMEKRLQRPRGAAFKRRLPTLDDPKDCEGLLREAIAAIKKRELKLKQSKGHWLVWLPVVKADDPWCGLPNTLVALSKGKSYADVKGWRVRYADKDADNLKLSNLVVKDKAD